MILQTPYIVLGVGCWMVLNGILHDIFVLKQHKSGYNRELLRLLLDGHILLTCGTIQIIAYSGLVDNQNWAYAITAIASTSLLVYCALIFPFLKSFGTIVINVIILILISINYFH